MKCIHFHIPSFAAFSQVKNTEKVPRERISWLSPSAPTRLLRQQKNFLPRTNAVNSSIVLGVSSPATTGDVTVLLQTSAALLFVYWIANFVVPEIIYKDLQIEETSKEQNPNDDNLKSFQEDEASTSSGRRKRGFQGTKR